MRSLFTNVTTRAAITLARRVPKTLDAEQSPDAILCRWCHVFARRVTIRSSEPAGDLCGFSMPTLEQGTAAHLMSNRNRKSAMSSSTCDSSQKVRTRDFTSQRGATAYSTDFDTMNFRSYVSFSPHVHFVGASASRLASNGDGLGAPLLAEDAGGAATVAAPPASGETDFSTEPSGWLFHGGATVAPPWDQEKVYFEANRRWGRFSLTV